MASLFGMVKSFTKKILKNPIKSAIVAFLIWQILKKEETKVENMDIQEQIKVLKKKGNKQLVFDTTSKKYAVIVGTNIKVFDNEQKARKAFGESLKEARDPILKGYSLDKLEKLIRIYKQFNDPESKRFTKELEKELKMRNKQSVSKRLSNSKERITTLHEKIILKEQGRQMTQANLKAFGESLKEAKKLSPDDERGLKGWVKDYKKARKAGNVRLAKQIRDNIVKVLKKLGVREPFKHPIWGRDPRLESVEVNKMNERLNNLYEKIVLKEKFDIKDIEDIVKNRQAKKIGGVLVDMQSANAILTVYKALSPNLRKKLTDMDVRKAASVAFKLVK